MARILCTHPNASTQISGIKFAPDERGGMISEDVPFERAVQFEGMAHFKVVKTPGDKAAEPAPTNMTRMDGPRGTFFVGGDITAAEIEAFRRGWAQAKLPGQDSDAADQDEMKAAVLKADEVKTAEVKAAADALAKNRGGRPSNAAKAAAEAAAASGNAPDA